MANEAEAPKATGTQPPRVLGPWERFDNRWLISELPHRIATLPVGGRCEGRVRHDYSWQVARNDDPNEWGAPVKATSLDEAKAQCEAELKRRGFILFSDLLAHYQASPPMTLSEPILAALKPWLDDYQDHSKDCSNAAAEVRKLVADWQDRGKKILALWRRDAARVEEIDGLRAKIDDLEKVNSERKSDMGIIREFALPWCRPGGKIADAVFDMRRELENNRIKLASAEAELGATKVDVSPDLATVAAAPDHEPLDKAP